MGQVLGVRRMMNILQDAGGFVVADFAGDTAARAAWTFAPWWRRAVFATGITSDPEMGIKWTQLVLAVVGGPMIRQIKVLPKPVARYWEIANAASAITWLTWQWREQAQNAMGLSDWVTSPGAAAPRVQPGSPEVNNAIANAGDGLSDWATVSGSASYTGDTFSM
jgi:hypothetical protein